jgi:hypothetical protein
LENPGTITGSSIASSAGYGGANPAIRAYSKDTPAATPGAAYAGGLVGYSTGAIDTSSF